MPDRTSHAPDLSPRIVSVITAEPLIVHEDQLLRIDRVMQLTGLGRSSIYELANEGRFPGPVQLVGTSVAWRAREVLEWIKSRPAVVLRTATRPVAAAR